MAYTLYLSCGSGLVYDQASQTLICDATGPNQTLASMSDAPYLTQTDLAVLLSAALGIWAAAWGFRQIGYLLFKQT